jgi:hypothetical protein
MASASNKRELIAEHGDDQKTLEQKAAKLKTYQNAGKS